MPIVPLDAVPDPRALAQHERLLSILERLDVASVEVLPTTTAVETMLLLLLRPPLPPPLLLVAIQSDPRTRVTVRASNCKFTLTQPYHDIKKLILCVVSLDSAAAMPTVLRDAAPAPKVRAQRELLPLTRARLAAALQPVSGRLSLDLLDDFQHKCLLLPFNKPVFGCGSCLEYGKSCRF